MKLSDLIKHTQETLPKFTKEFSQVLNVEKLSSKGQLCTVTTKDNHNLKAGDLITIEGAKIINEIVSLTQNRGLGTLITKYPHEITKNNFYNVGDSKYVNIKGANETEYNGSFLIMSVPNTNLIEFDIDENAPLEATGKPILEENTYSNFNGRFEVKEILDEKAFTYELPYIPDAELAVGDIVLKKGIRISGDYSIQNAIKAYTEQNDGELWGFIVLDGADVSKSRTNRTDAISDFKKGADFNLDLIQNVSLFVFVPTSNEYCWSDYSDLCQELRNPILKTLHQAKFKSGLYDEDCYLSYIGDNPVDVDGTAFLIYQYKFQTTISIYNEDGVEKQFMPRLKSFSMHEKNNFNNSKDTIEYISKGELPNETII